MGSKYERSRDADWGSIEPGQPDEVAIADLGDPEDFDVAVRWAGDHESDKLVTIPAEAWQPKDADGDPETDDLIATVSDDLCPDP